MKVKAAEGKSASKEGEVVEMVIFEEMIRGIGELGIVILSIHHLIDEVEGRYACQ
jgi:hypothetical protein